MTLLISPQVRDRTPRAVDKIRLRREIVVVKLSARVVQMPGRFEAAAVTCKAVPPEVSEHPNSTWVHLTTRGTWKGHPAGEFTFGDETFGQIIANFERTKTPVPFKYEHPMQMGGEPIPSAGKVYDLRANESGLWGFTKFTDRAAELIRGEEYEFCSVVVAFESTSRETGEEIGAELLEVGLTDNPFIDGQQKITLPPLAQAA